MPGYPTRTLLSRSLISRSLLNRSLSTDPDVVDYLSRFQTATGTQPSTSEISALNTFVTNCKSAGIWDKIFEFYPMLGTTIAGARVKGKVYKGKSTSLVNNGFVDADVIAGKGVRGNGSSKSLGTGITESDTRFGGFYAYLSETTTLPGVGSLKVMIGSTTGTPTRILALTATSSRFSWQNNTADMAYSTSLPAGLYYGSMKAISDSLKIGAYGFAQSDTTASGYSTQNTVETRLFATGSGASFLDKALGFVSYDNGQLTTAENIIFGRIVNNFLSLVGRVTTTLTQEDGALWIGQSLSIGALGTPALSTSQPYSNKMNGAVLYPADYSGLYAHVEATQESPAAGCANLQASVSSRVMTSFNFGVSGTGIAGLKKGTTPYNDSLTAITNNFNLSKYYSSTNFIQRALFCVHGEFDFYSNTYAADILQWLSDYNTDIKAITKQTRDIPMFVSQPSSWTSSSVIPNATTAKSPIAIYNAAKASPTKMILVCAKYIFSYQSDGVHLLNSSYRRLGEYYAKAYLKTVYNNLSLSDNNFNGVASSSVFLPVMPILVSRSTNIIDVQFNVPGDDLAFDTTTVTDPGNKGFEYTDDTSSASISSVAIISRDTVRITLSGTPTGTNKKIRYAYTGILNNDAGPTTGARGCLKSAELTYTSLNGYNLDDWCVHFEENVN